jgi:hypothetical protein
MVGHEVHDEGIYTSAARNFPSRMGMLSTEVGVICANRGVQIKNTRSLKMCRIIFSLEYYRPDDRSFFTGIIN